MKLLKYFYYKIALIIWYETKNFNEEYQILENTFKCENCKGIRQETSVCGVCKL